METFESYVQRRTDDALETEHYSPLGNSDLATHNKTFSQVFCYSVRCLCREIKEVATIPALEARLGDVLGLILVTILFPVFVLLRTRYSKKRARYELKAEWQRHINYKH